MRLWKILVAGLTLGAASLVAAPATAQFYEQHNLVADRNRPDENVSNPLDPDLINPWGLVSSATSPWWVADNGTARSTLYKADGEKQGLVVEVPGAPTGIVFNGDTLAFMIGQTGRAVFIFDSEDGTISAWNPSAGTQAVVVFTSPDAAVYKGLAIATTAAGPRLFATNFRKATVEVFDGAFIPVMPGGFQDPTIPAGYAPFGIQTVGDVVYVTYALQDKDKEDDVAGEGNGYVNAFDTAGNLLARVASRGQLNAPWGIAWAPDDFGKFGGHLLIGNFGDGRINAFALLPNGKYQARGTLRSKNGPPSGRPEDISIEGLWALQFGQGGANGNPSMLFFTAGPNDEDGGLFGFLTDAGPPGHNR
jgi:uncharacterized protein (TIGR03118 family)